MKFHSEKHREPCRHTCQITVEKEHHVFPHPRMLADHVVHRSKVDASTKLEAECQQYVYPRTDAFYADLLCISPKHLSKVIKETSGNRTLDVINKHAMQQIKLDLKLTDIPIQQIAIKYNFSNFSFFCQYVKQHLGMTPQEYRGK